MKNRMSLIFLVPFVFFHRCLLEVCCRIKRWYWELYSLSYMKTRRVECDDFSSLQFNGKVFLNFQKNAVVKIGNGFICNSTPRHVIDNGSFSKIFVANGATLTIGQNSGISNTVIQCWRQICIGSNVNIGAGCLLLDTDFHCVDWKKRLDRRTDFFNSKKAPIEIGDSVFIGARSIILKGVKIGDRAIISAGSVVTKDIPSDCIAAGNPCKIVCRLDDRKN